MRKILRLNSFSEHCSDLESWVIDEPMNDFACSFWRGFFTLYSSGQPSKLSWINRTFYGFSPKSLDNDTTQVILTLIVYDLHLPNSRCRSGCFENVIHC